ncbi:MAG: Stp1/IreP family PP2C-type Ser/Thr phosphatase [Caldilineaceae bacterium]|nr:Stp1/IreP family PP2C-type Ser/Thr phosphatase [Caldilineaceae bacterium]
MNSCPACGKAYRNTNARFCPHCGKPMPPVSSSPTAVVNTPVAPTTPINSILRPPQTPTQKLDTATQPRFGALPLGELIGTDKQRYEVLEILAESPEHVNAYRVKEYRLHACGRCQTATPLDSKFCGQCGAPLVAEPAKTWLLQEAAQETVLARKIALIKQGLNHAGLVNLHTYFVDQPFNKQPRYYVVMDDILALQQGHTFATLPKPQPLTKVRQWGQQIAETLAYLSSKQLHFPRLEADQILILDDAQVKLSQVETVVPFLRPELKQVMAEETRQLANLLQAQLQGHAFTTPLAALFTAATAPNQTMLDTPQQFMEALWASQAIGGQPATQPNINLLVGRLSDVGQQRQINEDSMLTMERASVHNSTNRPIGLYIVADGMGGHEGGEVASKLAAKTLADTLWPQLMAIAQKGTTFLLSAEPDYEMLVKQACQAAAKAVYEQARQVHKDMGTTLVAALVIGHRLYAANIGDSRLYKINRTTLKRITEDHSMVERLVKQQMLSPEEARQHPQANLIYRSLGDRPKVEVDIFQEELHHGDTLLLCSDGLSGQVTEAQIQALVVGHPPQEACQQLIQAANAAGGPDNITAIIVRVEAMDSSGA